MKKKNDYVGWVWGRGFPTGRSHDKVPFRDTDHYVSTLVWILSLAIIISIGICVAESWPKTVPVQSVEDSL